MSWKYLVVQFCLTYSQLSKWWTDVIIIVSKTYNQDTIHVELFIKTNNH